MNTGMVVMYGCAPYDDPYPVRPWTDPPNPWMPGPEPKRFYELPPAVATLQVCARCARHVRLEEPCPFCMQSRLDALEKRIDELIAKVKADFSSAQPKKRKRKK